MERKGGGCGPPRGPVKVGATKALVDHHSWAKKEEVSTIVVGILFLLHFFLFHHFLLLSLFSHLLHFAITVLDFVQLECRTKRVLCSPESTFGDHPRCGAVVVEMGVAAAVAAVRVEEVMAGLAVAIAVTVFVAEMVLLVMVLVMVLVHHLRHHSWTWCSQRAMLCSCPGTGGTMWSA
jgi:hypothetical protein